MAGSVRHSTASVSLATFAEFLRLSTKSSLVDFTFFSSWKWHAIWFEFQNGFRCLHGHVLNCILITEPVTSFHCIIKVPFPVILVHIAQSSINTSLGCNSVWSRREEFRNAGGFESGLWKPKGCPKSSTSGTYNYGVIFMINHCIIAEDLVASWTFSTDDRRKLPVL